MKFVKSLLLIACSTFAINICAQKIIFENVSGYKFTFRKLGKEVINGQIISISQPHYELQPFCDNNAISKKSLPDSKEVDYVPGCWVRFWRHDQGETANRFCDGDYGYDVYITDDIKKVILKNDTYEIVRNN